MERYKYYAFISYSRRDEKYAKWVQEKLESYNLPSKVVRDKPELKKGIRPVFRDKTDLGAGVLCDSLGKELADSKTLVVVASPASAKSEWVGNEIRAFLKTHSADNIIPFIVDGTPNSNDENDCLHPAIKEITPEILGISIQEIGKQQALTKVVAKMLNLSFDTLWQRQKRIKRRNAMISVILSLIVCALIGGAWYMNKPIDVAVQIDPTASCNEYLPAPQDIVVSLYLADEVKRDTLRDVSQPLLLKNIPVKYLGEEVRVTVETARFLPVDTTMTITKDLSIPITRDVSIYGHINGILFSYSQERPLPYRHLTICGHEVVTDAEGCFIVDIPLMEQRPEYVVSSSDTEFMDAVIHMPSQQGGVLLAQ